MKEKILRASFWVIVVAIGFIIVDIMKGQKIDIFITVTAALIMGLVDIIFSMVGDIIKRKNKQRA